MKRILIILVISMLLLTSCNFLPTSPEASLQAVGCFVVPGMFHSEVKGTGARCEILETDTQGRILFRYETFSLITQKEESAIVICQKYEPDYVYFYEDVCYLFSDWTDEDIENLKKQNDWDCPLDFEKMSRRHYSVSFDLFIQVKSQLDYPKVYTKFSQKLMIDRSQIKDHCFVDMDPNEKKLVLIVMQQNNMEKQYLVLVDPQYNIQTLEIRNVEDLSHELAEFKKDNGWVYGY